jgi:hypothetical protein
LKSNKTQSKYRVSIIGFTIFSTCYAISSEAKVPVLRRASYFRCKGSNCSNEPHSLWYYASSVKTGLDYSVQIYLVHNIWNTHLIWFWSLVSILVSIGFVSFRFDWFRFVSISFRTLQVPQITCVQVLWKFVCTSRGVYDSICFETWKLIYIIKIQFWLRHGNKIQLVEQYYMYIWRRKDSTMLKFVIFHLRSFECLFPAENIYFHSESVCFLTERGGCSFQYLFQNKNKEAAFMFIDFPPTGNYLTMNSKINSHFWPKNEQVNVNISTWTKSMTLYV